MWFDLLHNERKVERTKEKMYGISRRVQKKTTAIPKKPTFVVYSQDRLNVISPQRIFHPHLCVLISLSRNPNLVSPYFVEVCQNDRLYRRIKTGPTRDFNQKRSLKITNVVYRVLSVRSFPIGKTDPTGSPLSRGLNIRVCRLGNPSPLREFCFWFF